jgi:hypothetical protein
MEREAFGDREHSVVRREIVGVVRRLLGEPPLNKHRASSQQGSVIRKARA